MNRVKQSAGDLARRLEEAEATIKALLSGQIDAVVDPESSTPVLLAQAQSALRQSEESLRRERDRAQQYLDTAEVILLALDTDGRITLVNRYACSVLGWSAEELIGQDWCRVSVPERNQNQVRARIARALTGDSRTVDGLIVTRSGEERLVEWRNTLQRDSEGQVIGTLSCGTDVTARNHATEALRNASLALRTSTAELVERTKSLEEQTAALREQAALFDMAPVSMVVCDLQNRILFWNRGAEALYGWPRHEAIGANLQELLCIERSPENDAELLRLRQWEGEVTHVRRNGVPLTVSSRCEVHANAAGVPFRILSVAKDVTVRKRAEAERELLNKRLSLATAVAKVGVWEWDLRDNSLKWDATMFEIYGLQFSEADPLASLPYARWAESVHPDDVAEREASLLRTIANKGEGAAEFRIYLKDGSIRNVSAAERVVLNGAGEVIGVVGVNVDITGSRALEAELRMARDAAESANQAKSEFLANMSHEIRTPMNGILGVTGLLLDTDLDHDQRDHLKIVKASADALLTIINDILDFSRIEAGKLELMAVEFDPREVIAGSVEALQWRAVQKGLELKVEIESAVPRSVQGDPGRLRQILINLIGNAIKFTHHGEVRLTAAKIAAETKGSISLQFAVSDTGIGIPATNQGRIFEAFTQADGSSTRTYGGTGLGLTISSQLVRLFGGTLHVESEIGSGSTFSFTANFADPSGHAVDEARPPLPLDDSSVAEPRPMRHVLVVDDNKVNQFVAQRLLERRGHSVTLANNGLEAFTILNQATSAFDCVVMDLQMPVMGGLECAALIRGQEAQTGSHLRIIAATAHAMQEDERQCLAAGMDAYLSKPFNPQSLLDLIEQLDTV